MVVDVVAARQLGVRSLAVFGVRLFGVLQLTVAILFVAAVGDALRHDAEELELRVEGGDALVARVVDAAGPIKRQDVAEQVGIAVEEILAVVGVEEELLFVGAEQSVREPVDSAAPRLEPLAADVEAQSRVGGDLGGLATTVDGRDDRPRERDRVG